MGAYPLVPPVSQFTLSLTRPPPSQTDEEVDAMLVAAEPYKRGDMIDYRAFARLLTQ
jgi:hypothetical protein